MGWRTAQCLRRCGRRLVWVFFAEPSATLSPPLPLSRLLRDSRTRPPPPHLRLSEDRHARLKMVFGLMEPSSPLFHWLLQAFAPCFADPGSRPLTRLRRGSFVAETSCFFLKTKTRRRMMKRTMTKKMKKICLVELGQKIGIASLDS